MKYFAGLDVSLREIAMCVVDAEGDVVLRTAVHCEPSAVAAAFAYHGLQPDRVVHESGQISIWLQRGLMRLGLPTECIDARMAYKVLSARLNKSDRADAEGLAQLARTGWFTAVHVRSENADRLRTLIGARDRLVRLRIELEGHARGVLKTFGVRMTSIGKNRQRQAFREQLAAAKDIDPTIAAVADTFIVSHETLCIQAAAAARKGFKKAAVATARKLAVLMLALWKNGTEFGRHKEVI